MSRNGKSRNHAKIISVGGWSLIIMGLFYPIISLNFEYPEFLQGSVDAVLQQLISGGESDRYLWTVLTVVPMLLIFSAFGLCEVLKKKSFVLAEGVLFFGLVASFSLMIGLFKWTGVFWGLGEMYSEVSVEDQLGLAAVYHHIDLYLGTFIGRYLGAFSLYMFVLFTSLAIFRDKRLQNWMAWLGLVAVLFGAMGFLKDVSETSRAFYEVGQVLMFTPLWMILIGIALVRFKQPKAIYEENLSDDIANPSKKVMRKSRKKRK